MNKMVSAAVAAAVLTSPVASAHVSDDQWNEFQARFKVIAERVEALELENQRLQAVSDCVAVPVEDLAAPKGQIAVIQQQNKASGWAEKIAIKGDFRYRFESIDLEGVEPRERSRVRARVAMTSAVSEDLEVGFGLTTGGDNPVSGNQTLGGGGTDKSISLDKAYFKWRAFDGGYVQAGKFSNPLYTPQKSGLLWDGDWRPEGISVGWSSDALFINALGNYLESDSKKSNSAFSWGIQAGTQIAFGGAKLTGSVGYFDFPTQGNEPYYRDGFYGNSSLGGVYQYDYRMVELGADLGLNFADLPFNLYVNYVQNQDADAYDTGWLAGVKLGKASAKGTWELGYQYQELEADAVLGLLTDSNFAAGGTDGKGHRFTGAYAISKQWSLGATLYVNNKVGQRALTAEGGSTSYDRISLDTKFKY